MITIIEARRFANSLASLITKRRSIKISPVKSRQLQRMLLSNVRRYVDKTFDSRKIGFGKKK